MLTSVHSGYWFCGCWHSYLYFLADLTEDTNSRCCVICREHTGVPATHTLLPDKHMTLLETRSGWDSATVPPGLPGCPGGHLCTAWPLRPWLGVSPTPSSSLMAAHGSPQVSSELLCAAPKLRKLTKDQLCFSYPPQMSGEQKWPWWARVL